MECWRATPGGLRRLNKRLHRGSQLHVRSNNTLARKLCTLAWLTRRIHDSTLHT